MTKMLINDTADAVVKRKRDGHLFVTAEAQLASIALSLGIDEDVFGGIGNRKLSKIRGQKEMTSTLRNAMFDLELLSMTQGVAIQDGGSITVYKKEEGLKVEADEEDGLSVTITGTPKDNTVQVRNTQGSIEASAVATNTVAIPEGHAVEGDLVSVYYHEDVTGEVVDFKSDKFSEAYELEYHTIGYDPDTNIVMADVYIQLDHVIPSSDFELSFENGTAQTPEITFDALNAPNTNDIGRIAVVPRKA